MSLIITKVDEQESGKLKSRFSFPKCAEACLCAFALFKMFHCNLDPTEKEWEGREK